MLKFREYQDECIDAILAEVMAGLEALAVLACGLGKSLVQAGVTQRLLTAFPKSNVLVLVHVKELVSQNAKKAELLCSFTRVGVYCAGLRRKETKKVTVANIKSVANLEFFHKNFDIIIIDECDLIPLKEVGLYRKFLAQVRKHNPEIALIGLTATPFRLDAGKIYGKDQLFPYICYKKSLMEGINEGYLCNLTAEWRDTVDVSQISTVGGEFNSRQQSKLLSAMAQVEKHVDDIIESTQKRNRVLIFAVSTEHAQAVTMEFKRRGQSCELVVADQEIMTDKQRDNTIADFMCGRLKYVVNVGILTTGTDIPEIDAVMVLRATKSKRLFIQMICRGSRPVYAKGYALDTVEERLTAIAHSNKRDCLIGDYGGNFKRFGRIDEMEDTDYASRKGEGGGSAPVKQCVNLVQGRKCGEILKISELVCPKCGFNFPKPEQKNESEAYRGAITPLGASKSTQIRIKSVHYNSYTGKSGIPTLRVSYFPIGLGSTPIQKFVMLQHFGPMRTQAREWWTLVTGEDEAPKTVEEALEVIEEKAKKVIAIETAKDGKYDVITNYIFEGAKTCVNKPEDLDADPL